MSEHKTTHPELAKSPCFTESSKTTSRPERKRIPLPKTIQDINTKGTNMSKSNTSQTLTPTLDHEDPTTIQIFPALAKADPQLSADAEARLEADKERIAQISRENGALGGRPRINIPELAKYCLKQWVKDYNEDFPHSALNYETPCDYERWFYASLSK